jgi:transcription termination factor Rho
MNLVDLELKTCTELRNLAQDLDLPGYSNLERQDLIFHLLQEHTVQSGSIFSGGVLEVVEDGFGFLRQARFLPSNADVYVSQSQIRRFGLRTGDLVIGQVRPPKDNEKFYSLLRVEAINGLDPEVTRPRPHFEVLTPIFPREMFNLETSQENISGRLINLVAPIGRGQRGLIVSPPKAGKTMLLKAIANSITHNYNDVHLLIALIGERPEEVTDMKRSVRAEVIGSTFDEPPESHIHVAEMVLERAKRLVESGRDVVVLLDSITRLSRAYNLIVQPSGRTLSGGIDPSALFPPKHFFGAARNIEGGGSLTIIATCLIDTGSVMDLVIYEEFKGTGNMELILNRKLAERRVFPAIDISLSSTRREELLLDEKTYRAVVVMRRMFSMLSDQPGRNGLEAMEALLQRLAKTSNNLEFLSTLKGGF